VGGSLLSCLVLLGFACPATFGQMYAISTFAGGGFPSNVPGTSASLDRPGAIAVDRAGNVFFAQPAENVVLRWDAKTGLISLVAGNGTPGFSGDDGLAVNARLNGPAGLAVDSAGNLFISDTGNQRVRRVANGVIATVAGGGTSSADNVPATSARFYEPLGIAVDSSDALYITDGYGQGLRKVTGGIITTAVASLEMPYAVTVDSAGGIYVIAGLMHNTEVVKVSGGQTQVLASIGPPGQTPNPARYLISPQAIAVDSTGRVYISDPGDSRVVTVSGGAITMAAGTGTQGYTGDGGPAVNAELNNPGGIAFDPSGNLYIAAGGIRRLTAGTITTVAGSPVPSGGDGGPATSALLTDPFGVAVDAAGNVYVGDANTEQIRKVAAGAGTIATVAQLNDSPHGIAVDASGNIYAVGYILCRVSKISGGAATTLAGAGGFLGALGDGGPATSAHLNYPNGVATDSAGNVYIADTGNNRIRRVSGGIITTVAGNGTAGFAGDGGPATSAELNAPNYVAVDSAGNLYISDTGNKRIREVASGGVITTIASGLTGPGAIAVDSAANLYFADGASVHRFSDGTLATIAGAGSLINPQGIAVDSAGDVYVSDAQPGAGSGVIRLLTPNATPHIAAGGIVPVYSSVPAIQPGSWISIYGSDLADKTYLWNNDFPTSLGGVSVTIDNKPACLWLVSPTQINLQAPDDQTTGLVSVVVTTPFGTVTSRVMLAPQSPSLSLLGDEKHVAGEIPTAGGGYDLAGPANTFSYPARPVKAGETLVLYGVGFGPTNPAVPAGRAFSGSAPTTSPVSVTIGGLPASVMYAGIIQAGLYQINVIVPAAASGDQPIVAAVNGMTTPSGPVVTVQ
jgi:uncharacterized protein (TIGR03437 family)